MMAVMQFFTAIIILQLFYSFSFTMIAYALAPFNLNNMQLTYQPFQSQIISTNDLASKVQTAASNQLNIPLYDLGALVYFSGNIVIDLIINFFTALPGIFNLIVDAFCMVFNIPAYYAITIKITIFTILTITYFIMLIQFVLGIRSRGAMVQ